MKIPHPRKTSLNTCRKNKAGLKTFSLFCFQRKLYKMIHFYSCLIWIWFGIFFKVNFDFHCCPHLCTIIFLFCLGATLVILMDYPWLCTQITPSGLGTIWDPRYQTGVNCMQSQHPPCCPVRPPSGARFWHIPWARTLCGVLSTLFLQSRPSDGNSTRWLAAGPSSLPASYRTGCWLSRATAGDAVGDIHGQ